MSIRNEVLKLYHFHYNWITRS